MEPQVRFLILVAKFINLTNIIVKNKVVAILLAHPENIIPRYLTYTNLLVPADTPRRNYKIMKSIKFQSDTEK